MTPGVPGSNQENNSSNGSLPENSGGNPPNGGQGNRGGGNRSGGNRGRNRFRGRGNVNNRGSNSNRASNPDPSAPRPENPADNSTPGSQTGQGAGPARGENRRRDGGRGRDNRSRGRDGNRGQSGNRGGHYRQGSAEDGAPTGKLPVLATPVAPLPGEPPSSDLPPAEPGNQRREGNRGRGGRAHGDRRGGSGNAGGSSGNTNSRGGNPNNRGSNTGSRGGNPNNRRDNNRPNQNDSRGERQDNSPEGSRADNRSQQPANARSNRPGSSTSRNGYRGSGGGGNRASGGNRAGGSGNRAGGGNRAGSGGSRIGNPSRNANRAKTKWREVVDPSQSEGQNETQEPSSGRWISISSNFNARPAPTVPIRTNRGIKARSQRGAFSKNWWARRWIEAMERLVDPGRLQRGRSYARAGQVLSIEETKHGVEASVQGSRPQPYRVTIEVTPLTDDQWELVIDALSEQALFAAQLLAGEMPGDIEDAFNTAGISLFPNSSGDLFTSCSCPDWANPCKHVAATQYILGDRFDDDPFLLFRMRGRTQEQILEALRQRRAGENGGEEVSAAEEESTAPAPEAENVTPLNELIDRFWEPDESLDTFPLTIKPPSIEMPLLKRLGEPAFLNGETLQSLLKPVYDMFIRSALRAAYSEEEPIEGNNGNGNGNENGNGNGEA